MCFLKKDLPIRMVPTQMDCASQLSMMLLERVTLECWGRDPSFCESKMWVVLEGIIVKENCFHIYDPQNCAVLYIAKSIHFPQCVFNLWEAIAWGAFQPGIWSGCYWEDAIKGSIQKHIVRIIKPLSFSLPPTLSEHPGYRNDPFVHCSRNCINVDYFQ